MTDWQRSSWALVKTTGFGYELLEELADSRASRPGADDDEIEQAVHANVAFLLRAVHDDRFAEAVHLSSPSAAQAIWSLRTQAGEPSGLRSKDKNRLITIGMYLQRLCTKNESTSFFGPVHWARIEPGGDTVVQPGGTAPRRGVFFAHWAVQQLADRIAADPAIEPYLVPRLPPDLVVRDGRPVRRMEFVESPARVVEVRLPDDDEQVWQLIDGCRTAADIADECGLSPVATVAALRRLAAAGVAAVGLEIPMGGADSFDALAGYLGTLSAEAAGHWPGALGRLRGHRDDFAAATGLAARIEALRQLKETFTEITGAEAERNAGQLAADRAVVIEDCSADWPRFDLGGPLAEYLDDELPRLLDLFYELPLARRRARLDYIRDWFDARFPAGRPVPLDEVLLATAEDDHAFAHTLREIDDTVRRDGPSAITDQLWAHPDESRVELDLAWADRERARLPFDTWSVSGVDLFVAAESVAAINRGEFVGVVGEIHALHDQLLQGLWPRLHPDPESLRREIGQRIADVSPHTVCDPTLPHRRKTMAREDVLPEIEFNHASTRPVGRRLRSADLRVINRDGELQLVGEPFGPVALTRPPFWWWDHEIESIFGAFAGARIANMVDTVRSGGKHDHLPRLTVGRTVVARETWWYQPSGTRRRYRSLAPVNQRDIMRLKDQLGLPDQVFVRFAEEPKPVFVDFGMPYLVDLFARLLSHTDQRVEIGEMMPGPRQLWLRDQHGRHPGELRIGYYRAADPTERNGR